MKRNFINHFLVTMIELEDFSPICNFTKVTGHFLKMSEDSSKLCEDYLKVIDCYLSA